MIFIISVVLCGVVFSVECCRWSLLNVVSMMLCWGAAVNCFVETYRFLVPAFVTGNILVEKVPCVSGLVPILLMEIFTKNLLPNTVQFFVGTINVIAAPLTSIGEVDMLALAGAARCLWPTCSSTPTPVRTTSNSICTSRCRDSRSSASGRGPLSCGQRGHRGCVPQPHPHLGTVSRDGTHLHRALFLRELCSAMRLLKCLASTSQSVRVPREL